MEKKNFNYAVKNTIKSFGVKRLQSQSFRNQVSD